MDSQARHLKRKVIPPQRNDVFVPPAEGNKAAKEETKKEGMPEPVPTTSSLTNLFDGMSCESPYEAAIVDERDSLYNTLRVKDVAYVRDRARKESASDTQHQRHLLWA